METIGKEFDIAIPHVTMTPAFGIMLIHEHTSVERRLHHVAVEFPPIIKHVTALAPRAEDHPPGVGSVLERDFSDNFFLITHVLFLFY